MAGGGYTWSRRAGARARTLRALVRDTQRALQDVSDILPLDPEVSSRVAAVGHRWSVGTALVVCGASARARVRLLHALLNRQLLPEDMPRGCRWIRIQYGSSTAVHLSVGNSEFELVEELRCNAAPWAVIPTEDLLRKGPQDLTTILEIELNNQFLRDGLQIVIPPDIETEPSPTISHITLKSVYSDLYTKRESIFKTFNPVFLFALEYMGKNIFYDNIGCPSVSDGGEEDFWSKYSFFNMNWREDLKREEGGREVWSDAYSGEEPTVFTAENCLDLYQFREVNPHSQLLFFLFSDARELPSPPLHESETTESAEDNTWAEDLTEADRQMFSIISKDMERMKDCENRSVYEEQVAFMNELIDQWELMSSPPKKHYVRSQWAILDDTKLQNDQKPYSSNYRNDDGNRLIESRSDLLGAVVKFANETLHSYLLEYSTKLSEIHVKLLQQFILASFDMARELQIVPKKIQYVAVQEQHLYQAIHEKFSKGDKKQELVQMMEEVLEELKEDVEHMDWSVDDLPWHQEVGRAPPPHLPPSPSPCPSPWARRPPSPGEEASDTYLEEYDIIHEGEHSWREYTPSPLPSSIPVENESGTASVSCRSDVTACTNCSVSLTHATLDVQHTVLSRLSRKISLKLVDFVDCLKETYFGTLQRCIESLEWSCGGGGGGASAAVRQLLAVATHVQLSHSHAYSVLTTLLHSLRRLLFTVRVGGGGGGGGEGGGGCVLAAAWRRRAARHAASGLSAHRLARVMSHQILERLSSAHEKCQSALASLETALANRLHHTEDIKLAIRKKYAPLFARLCLESTSMCDLLMYGTPELGKDLGRGQYGVVYAVRGSWAGKAPLAAKSVLPEDTRHYHDLAMEFFYARSIPPHPRIVRLYGSIVQKNGGGDRMVLLVSERKVRDLHTAVRLGLAERARIQIACDIVEGIRYLHSLGLIHRDIKLKNVVLDGENRAAITDLGFCSCRALLSGSVVGTPVHMAPEMLDGDYDASVDVYAFGILFWYLCANDVKLPEAFEYFANKEQLWSKVKKGRRPERLAQFSDESWSIMQACWEAQPSRRALPGHLQPRLQALLARADHNLPSLYIPHVEPQRDIEMSTLYLEE